MAAEEAKPLTRAVYDTNVLFSAAYGYRRARDTAPVLCLDAVLEGIVGLTVSPYLLAELYDALAKRLSPSLAAEAADLIGEIARLVEPPGTLRVLERDSGDNPILECAVAANASRLVTGNVRHFEELRERPGGPIRYGGVQVVRPAEFLLALIEELPAAHGFRVRLDDWQKRREGG